MSAERAVSYVSPLDPERMARTEAIFGSPLIPVIDDEPELVFIGGALHLVFWVDLERLRPEQVEAMLVDLVARFEMSLEEGRAELAHGVPLLAEDTLLLSSRPLGGAS